MTLSARSQLEAIRDEWLAPLVTTIRQQAETIGRVTAERDAAAEERDRLRAERDGDRKMADQFVDVLQQERDELQRRLVALEPKSPGWFRRLLSWNRSPELIPLVRVFPKGLRHFMGQVVISILSGLDVFVLTYLFSLTTRPDSFAPGPDGGDPDVFWLAVGLAFTVMAFRLVPAIIGVVRGKR